MLTQVTASGKKAPGLFERLTGYQELAADQPSLRLETAGGEIDDMPETLVAA
jgi:hypothetical protein